MYKFLLGLCLVLAGVTATSVQEYDSRIGQRNGPMQANMNQYVDILMFQIGPWLSNGILPMNLPDIVEGFEHQIILITYRGTLQLTNGRFTAIGNVQRAGNAFMTYDRMFLRVSVTANLRNMNFNYDYHASIMDLGPTGWADVAVDTAGFRADLLIDLWDFQVYLEEFGLTTLTGIDVRMRGNSLIDWLLNIVINLIANIFRNVVMNVVSGGIRDFLLNTINTINNRQFSSAAQAQEAIMEALKFPADFQMHSVK